MHLIDELSESNPYIFKTTKLMLSNADNKEALIKHIESSLLLSNMATEYYVNDKPIGTDSEYDTLYRKVKKYEDTNPTHILENSPTNRVGDKLLDGFVKNTHTRKMWSLDNIYDDDGLKTWSERVSGRMSCEPKFDGLSLRLGYENCKLVYATTRGDGFIGEDVLANSKMVPSIPLVIPYIGIVEIRGEIVINKDNFIKMNLLKETLGEKPFISSRSAAAGGMRTLDPQITKNRKLEFYPWDVISDELLFPDSSGIKDFLKTQGFKQMPLFDVCDNVKSISNFYDYMLDCRDDLNIEIDGMVIKKDDLREREEIGYTRKHPKWAIAYKFPATEVTVTIKDIELNTGRTGIIIPVAIFDPVAINESVVTHCNLHNFNNIEKLELLIGDKAILIKSGDVIPKIIGVYKTRRDGTQKKFIPPTKCPSCGTKLSVSGANLQCDSLHCDEKKIRYLIRFVSKGHFNVDHVGEGMIRKLYTADLISYPMNLYSLCYDSLVSLDGIGHSKAVKIIEGIRYSKGATLVTLLRSLNMNNIPSNMFTQIVERYGFNFITATKEDLLRMDGVGEESVNEFLGYVKNNMWEINQMIQEISPTLPSVSHIRNNPLKNKQIVLTGKFSKGKNKLIDKLVSLGARVCSSMSRRIDFIVIGESPGTKVEKAKEYGTVVISEEEIFDL